ncbi:MAG: hypothetical protein ACLQLT_09430 [Methylovirgula sp.]
MAAPRDCKNIDLTRGANETRLLFGQDNDMAEEWVCLYGGGPILNRNPVGIESLR